MSDYQTYDAFVKTTRGDYCDNVYTILAMAGEAGEVANEMKKVLRGDREIDKEVFAHELGDVLWYLTCTANNLGFTLQEIMNKNMDKLIARRNNGLKGR